MNEIDLDRLGDLWRAPPPPAELERLRAGAAKVQRRARWGQLADFWAAILVAAIIIVLLVSNPRLETSLLGGATLLYMLYGTIRQRRLREIELRTLSGSTERMLDLMVARLEATVKRARLNLWSAVPGIAVGIGFGWALDRGTGSPLLTRFAASPLTAFIIAGTISVLAVLSVVHFTQALRRAKRELREITHIREDFQFETDRSER